HRAACLSRYERIHGALEFRHGVAGRQPPQISALGAAGILGVQARQLGEISLVVDTFLEARETPARFGFRDQFIGLDQDMPGMGLAYDHWRRAAAALVQLKDMKSVGAAKYRTQSAYRHGLQRIHE